MDDDLLERMPIRQVVHVGEGGEGGSAARSDVFGLSAGDLAARMREDPGALLLSLRDFYAQGAPELTADLAPPVPLRRTVLSEMLIGIARGGLAGDALPGLVGILGFGKQRPDFAAEEAEDGAWITWLERLFQPYHRTGVTRSDTIYAPCLDLFCDPAIEKTVTSEASYSQTTDTTGTVKFSSPGFAANAKFTKTVSGTTKFSATRGTHQLTLPVEIEIEEWKNYNNGDTRYSARVLDVHPPIQVDPFEPRYRSLVIAGLRSFPVGSNVTPLDFAMKVARGMSIDASAPFTLATGVSLGLSYQASIETVLDLGIKGGSRIYTMQAAPSSPLALRLS